MYSLIIFFNFIPLIVESAEVLRGYHFTSNSVDDVTNFVKIYPEKNISYEGGITICLRTQVSMFNI
jgi:hypothetical protein